MKQFKISLVENGKSMIAGKIDVPDEIYFDSEKFLKFLVDANYIFYTDEIMVFYRTSDKFIIRDNVIGQMILQGEINSIKFSENQIKNYIENQATKCPFCGSENIVPDCTEVEGIRYISEMGCNNCEKTWTELFELKTIY